MDNVIQLPGTERDIVPLHQASDLPVTNVINDKVGEKLEVGVVVGLEDGELYVASSTPDLATMILLLERAKLKLIRIYDNEY